MFRVCAVHNLMHSSTCAPTHYGSSLYKQHQEAVHILMLYQHHTLKHVEEALNLSSDRILNE